jgi:hypothetical protein
MGAKMETVGAEDEDEWRFFKCKPGQKTLSKREINFSISAETY